MRALPNIPPELFRLPSGRLAMVVSRDPPHPEEAKRAVNLMQFWGIMYLDLVTIDELLDRYGDLQTLDMTLKRGAYAEITGLDATSRLAQLNKVEVIGGERPLNRFERRSARAKGII